MKRLKKLFFAMLAILLTTGMQPFTLVHADGEGYTLEYLDAAYPNGYAYAGRYGYERIRRGVGSGSGDSANSPVMWKINGSGAFCANVLEGTRVNNQYEFKTELSQYLSLDTTKAKYTNKNADPQKLAAIAWYGLHEFTGDKAMNYMAAQFLIWDIINLNEAGKGGYQIINTSADEISSLNTLKAEILKKAENAMNFFTFSANIYSHSKGSIQIILGDVVKTPKSVPPFVFQKYLILDQNDSVPAVSFTYSCGDVSDEDIQHNDGFDHYSMSSGYVSQLPEIQSNADFACGAETFADKETISELKDNEKYAVTNVQVDFSNVKFQKPGIYHFCIRENADDALKHGGIVFDSDLERYLDVSVETTGQEGVMAVAGYEFHKKGQTTKSPGFINHYVTHNLKFQKTVSGGQGSVEEYFSFAVSLNGGLPNRKYPVDLNNAEGVTQVTAYNSQTYENPGELIADGSGNVSGTFWLRHGQSVEIREIGEGTDYSIGEDVNTLKQRRYVLSLAALNGDTRLGDNTNVHLDPDTYQIHDDALNEDTEIIINNDKEGIVPTGLHLPVWPAYLILAGSGILLVLLITWKPSRR